VPVYQSPPLPIYILHTRNIKLPRSAEVPQSKLQWVHDFDSSTQFLGHTVYYNGSMTLIHPFQSYGQIVSNICQSSTTQLWEGCRDWSLWHGSSGKVALTGSLCKGRSDKVTLTRLLLHGCSHKFALARSLWQSHSDKVPLIRSLWLGRSDKVALTRSFWNSRSGRLFRQCRPDKVALAGCSDRLLWQADRTLGTSTVWILYGRHHLLTSL
jgi:hypothetical protein